ncbi:hypothetical protein FB45DRAFT_938273 [Roridomyces roridus]|uniref:Uncharacterized protein n=1 Tax=Roridomyces roridus TaxID=1738132 RepID=A0AAD7FDB9_9AGAR|nr:hypothetical protein FB45DRAFT_938273 [Roridomyces roridus]
MKILRKSKGFRNNRFLHCATIVLFFLSTIHLFLLLPIAVWETKFGSGWILTILDTEDGSPLFPAPPQEPLVRAAFGIYVTSNIIADSIFVGLHIGHMWILTIYYQVFRCYAIWGFRLLIVAVPALCTLCVAALGYWQVIQPDKIVVIDGRTAQAPIVVSLFTIPILISLATTMTLMILSAGRIWWLGCRARKLMGYKTGRYYTVCAMILESGALYVAGALLLAILSMVYYYDDLVMSAPITAQLAGIAPTIIAVRVGLNKSVESVDSFAIAVQRPRQQMPSVDFQVSTTGLIEPPPVVYLHPENIIGAQKFESV